MSTPRARAYRIAVIGAGSASAEERYLARAVGQLLAESGAVVVCGGRSGVMEAVAEGAAEAQGISVGLLPDDDDTQANRWLTVALPTGLGEARNALVVRAAEAAIAIGGGWGTLSEISLASKMGIGVTTLGTPPAPTEALGVPASDGPAEAVAWAIEQASGYRKRLERA